MRPAPACALLLAAILCAEARPQGQRGTAETDLHAAWLGELLDLDVAGAARTYAAVVTDANAQKGRRLVALARLRELERMGAVQPVSLGLEGLDVPPELADAGNHLAQVRDPFDRLAEQARQSPQGLPAWLEDGEHGRFHVRALVPLIYRSALETADATVTRERVRQLRQQLQEATRRNDAARKTELQKQLQQLSLLPVNDEPEVRMLQRIRALHVLKLEVNGYRTQAERQRTYWTFRDPRPRLAGVPFEEQLDLARHNLALLRESRDLLQGEADVLRRLGVVIDAEAATKGAASAVQLINRLPIYRGLLLRSR